MNCADPEFDDFVHISNHTVDCHHELASPIWDGIRRDFQDVIGETDWKTALMPLQVVQLALLTRMPYS